MLPSLVAVILLPAVVARLLRARLLGVGNDRRAHGPLPAEAEKRRSNVLRLLCVLTIVVAVLQAAAGYEIAQFVYSLGGSGGPRGWREIWDERRPVNLAIAIGPVLVLGTLLIAALRRRRADLVYTLALWGNYMLALVGFVVSFVVNNVLY